jgi:hypothetical protein
MLPEIEWYLAETTTLKILIAKIPLFRIPVSLMTAVTVAIQI